MRKTRSSSVSAGDVMDSIGLPPVLYHGTHTGCLADILERGIEPRGDRDSTWDANPSRSNFVYLTVAYPIYFAISSLPERSDGSGDDDVPSEPAREEPVVIETDVRELQEVRL